MSATPNSTLANSEQLIADLQRQLAECKAERDEALQRETATAEVLQVINSSPGDLAPVFDAILDKAMQRCGAAFGILNTYDGSRFNVGALRGVPAEVEAVLRSVQPSAHGVGTRVLRGEDVVIIEDFTASPSYLAGAPRARALVEAGGVRSYVGVALRKDGRLLGTIGVYRQEVRPFTEKHIALLQNFAAQAVIAMENARLLTETREALEQQTATAEVLQVINSSPGDLSPVFDGMLEKAMRLCEAGFGILWTYDGESFHAAAMRNVPAPYAEFLTRAPYQPEPEGAHGRIVNGESLIHIVDVADTELYRSGDPLRRALVDLGGARSGIAVALRKDDTVLGIFVIYRQEVRRFSDKQIALLQNFAAQAVIAMENARLLTETREALEQQTATAEVLGVINSSPGDLSPVFDAMLEKATRLCEAPFGILRTWDGERFDICAVHGDPRIVEFMQRRGPIRPPYPRGSAVDRLLRGERLVHMIDPTKEDAYRDSPLYRGSIDAGNIRTSLTVPLRKDDALLGAIVVYRQEVRPFSDKQIALLQNFAVQAVIAMENARLLTETREALEQQTATAEVLQVINSSPGDLAPVFDSLLEKALRLCEAAFGILIIWDGEQFHRAAFRGVPDELISAMQQPLKPVPGGLADRLVRGERIIVIPDLLQPGDQLIGPGAQLLVRFGARSYIAIALRRDEALLGGIVIYRREVRPFTDKQIALLENFAAQAVIAMENARLITETREALEQQTATAEVLQVINSSPGDLAPVFEAMLEKAIRLCDGVMGVLWTLDGERGRPAASRGLPAEYVALLHERGEMGTIPPLRQVARGERVIQFLDTTEHELYRSGDPVSATAAGIRTLIWIALVKDGAAVGAFVIGRPVVRPFSDKQIALLQNFAAQAVIAMENARLLTETREALEQQTATAEVLQVINSSPGDLAPVFDAMLDRALQLCGAAFGILHTFDGERVEVAAYRGVSPAFAEFLSSQPPELVGAKGLFAEFLRGESFVHIDAACGDAYRAGVRIARALVEIEGGRSLLAVPLRRDEALLGAFVIYRREVRTFSEKQIALLQNFAAQAVIAMENARLLTETREALEQQTATAEVLQVINSSPGDLTPVFDAILEKATQLCEAPFGVLRTWDGERFHHAAVQCDPKFTEWARGYGPFAPAGPSSPAGRIVSGEEVVRFTDAPEEESVGISPGFRALVEASGMRSGVTVALRKDDALLGNMTVYRQEVRPFTDKQIALLQNFAAQAVIAMENARLLDEIRQRQQELRVTFDNMVDGVAMFDEALHLAAWNRNFQELLQLPDELLAKRQDFNTYIRYLVERGEFGETDPEMQIARLRARIGDHYSFERTRPDGTVIEVRHNPMPGGGIVLIYSDITERKHSEAEIKAARDAAEAAYRDLKAAQASLIQAEKMASLGQLTAGIAHEIKNPLNFVNNFAGLSVELLDELKETATPAISALDDEKRAEIDETIEMLSGNLGKIAEHGRRADNIVTSMLQHSRGSSGERRSVDLNALIEEALNLAYHGGRAQDQSFNITIERDYAAALAPIELVPQDITRVCLNLFGNGFYAATKRQKERSDASFKPTLKVSTRELGEAVEIRVRDNGIGISPEIKDKLFQPFFTTKPSGEGTGLGLSISYDVVTQQHGGTITVDSRVGEFTEFAVRLPRAYRATTAEAAS